MARASRKFGYGKAAIVLPFFLAQPATVSAKTKEVTLEPITMWYVYRTESSCQMRRWFGERDSPMFLQFEKFSPAPKFQLVAMGEDFRGLEQGGELHITYGSGQPRRIRVFFRVTGTPSVLIPGTSLLADPDYTDNPTKVTPAMEAAVKSITLSWLGKSLTLDTGPLDEAFNALRSCTDKLLEQWGLDPEQHATLRASRFLPMIRPAG